MRVKEYLALAGRGTCVIPLSNMPGEFHDPPGPTEAGWFTKGRAEQRCYLCRLGVCIQRVTERGVIVHGRLG